ncbi:MAG: MlaD family protein [Bacteroidota bacterium]
MSRSKSQNIRLGLFVIAGTFLLIASLYFIGSRQNLFGKTFTIKARFHNVSGLMPGHNVRFSGIDVGTVESVEIADDTSVMVTMIIEDDVRSFIKSNAIASVGTDGLMGNKLVNITSVPGNAESVEDGDELNTQPPIDLTDAMLTLNSTNKNLEEITGNLVAFTNSISDENSLWSILSDSVVAGDVKEAVNNLKLTTEQSRFLAADFRKLTGEIRSGKGATGKLISDTLFAYRLQTTLGKLDDFGDSVKVISGEITTLLEELKKNKSTAGLLLNDTMLMHNLNQSLLEIESGAKGFNENMEALKHTWPLKRYFRKKL